MAVLGWFVVPVLRVELDEGGIPSRPGATSLPEGVQALTEDELCGSGGCYRVLTLGWPGHSRAEVLASVGLAGTLPQETCRPASLLDRRRVCVGADDVLLRQPGADDQVQVSVRWQRPLGL